MHSKTELKGKQSNFQFEAKLYYESVSKLKYIVCHIRETFKFTVGNKIILEQKQDISAGLSNAFFGDFHGKNPMN